MEVVQPIPEWVSFSYCYCSRGPQTSWLKMDTNYSLGILTVRNTKCIGRTAFFLQALGENLFP